MCVLQYEILLCVQDHDDPAVDVCKKLLGKYPNVDARLFIGEEMGSVDGFFWGWVLLFVLAANISSSAH